MDIDRFKVHHVKIVAGIDSLRKLARAGVKEHARDIAQELGALSRLVTQHLAVEDRILYPTLAQSSNQGVAAMSARYQQEMKGIAFKFINFARQWSDAAHLAKEPEGFRAEANMVLRGVYERIQRENREFYPTVERL